jgi:hypothetical protein
VHSRRQAKSHINDKRTFFGRHAIKIVTAFFDSTDFADNCFGLTISDYAQWAARSNGPGIWEIPTPIDCLYPVNSPRYIVHPKFHLYSPFRRSHDSLCSRNPRISFNQHSSYPRSRIFSNRPSIVALILVIQRARSPWLPLACVFIGTLSAGLPVQMLIGP